MRPMTQPQARSPFTVGAWPATLAAGLFVLVTHYIHVAAGAPFDFLVIETGLALLFLAAGAVAWNRRPTSRTGPILVVSSVLWSLGGYGPTGIEPVWALGFAFEGYYDPAFALLAMTFPADRLSRVGRLAMSVLLAGFVLRSLGRLVLQDPPRTYPDAFPDGPGNPFAFLQSRAAFEVVEVATSVAVLLAVLAVAFLAVRRLLSGPSLARSVVGPVLAASGIAMGFAALEAGDTAWSTAFGSSLLTIPDEARPFTNWLAPAGRAIVPVAFLLGTLRLRSPRGPLPALAARLASGEGSAEVDAALAAYIENRELADLLSS